MPEAFYELLEESSDRAAREVRGRVRSSAHTTGPWDSGLQHAGPPAALLTRAVQRLGGLPPHSLTARLSFDILAPVPVGDLVLTARTPRPGRRVALAEAELAAAVAPDRPLMTLRAWLVRQLPTNSPAAAAMPVTPIGAPLPWAEHWTPTPRPPGWIEGYLDAIEWYWVEGSFETPGPAAVWTRLRVGLVDGEEPGPVERLVAVADSASGISAVASPEQLLFVNTDLTLHLTREPVGDTIWMRAQTSLSANGIGAARGSLGDRVGEVATSGQCLFVAPQLTGRPDHPPPDESRGRRP